LDAEEAGSESHGKSLYPDTAKLGHGEVTELVDNNHHADKDDEGNDRNEKLMHKCVDFSKKKPAALPADYNLTRAEP
jgi:hypothetical protein